MVAIVGTIGAYWLEATRRLAGRTPCHVSADTGARSRQLILAEQMNQ
jgi:hypothetical protein